ncbi:MAG: type II toxin-antitoxin system RelE/ParE family toxin [Candidatus Aenigmarchaeota archaeon]|nr:type II toxin-antitoxin system RelE/ParE family toxin [Candidatus Aenigmarchaeota archaeon]
MSYSVFIKEPAERALKRLDKEIQRRFAKRIDKLATNPQSFGKPLRNVLAGYWEAYFEKSFRIVYTIDENSKKITIEAIKHKDEF